MALPGTSSTALDRLARAVAGLNVVSMVDADDAGGQLRAKLTPPLVAAGCSVAHLRPPAPDLDDWRRACGCDDDRWASEVNDAIEGLAWEESAHAAA